MVAFTAAARDEIDAYAVASQCLRDAWTSLGIDATPGDDYDASGLTVERIVADLLG